MMEHLYSSTSLVVDHSKVITLATIQSMSVIPHSTALYHAISVCYDGHLILWQS